MNTSKFLTGTIVGTIVGFGAGFLIFGFALGSFMEANTSGKAEPEMLWLVLGHLFYAALLTYIFLQWAGISTPMTGAKAGFIITLLGGLGTNMIWYAVSNLFTSTQGVFIDAVAGAVVWAIAGAAIGWVLGRGNE